MPKNVAAQLDIIRNALGHATKRLCREDSYLILNDVQERAVMARLALYLQSELAKRQDSLEADLVVDCEYNRDGDDYKALAFEAPPRAHELVGTTAVSSRVAPDIIVHRRGDNASNMLVVEVKKAHLRRSPAEQAAIEMDIKRLRRFMDRDWRYFYKLGALVVIEKRGQRLTEQSATIEFV